MKTTFRFLLLISFALLAITSCNNKGVRIDSFKLDRERVVPSVSSVNIAVSYYFAGTVYGMNVNVGEMENLSDAVSYNMQLDGSDYTVTIGDLKPSTKYYYRYGVDFGMDELFLTEIGSFMTKDAEAPMVKTLEVVAVDSSVFQVKCNVVSDGGSEVTERGVCWNTNGNPNMHDHTLRHTTGGLGPYTMHLEDLSLSTKYYVRAYAKNAGGVSFGEVLEFRTGSEVLLPEVNTVEVRNVTYHTATCLGHVVSTGGVELTERGVCWGIYPSPSINVNYAVADGTGTGDYSVDIDGLAANTTYHVRCYAKNRKGVSYGDDMTFTTAEGLPTVTTSTITNITATSAKGGGTVTDQGASNVTQRGICWSTSHNPTVSGSHANSGTNAGIYTVNMSGLTANTKYYVRAYATNAQGTAYGNEVSFTTLAGLPTVTTLNVTDITANTAKGHGKVTNQGASTVTQRGICWSTSPNPTINDSHGNSGTGTGEYEVRMTGLQPGTKYYVRAYATNAQGTAYGEQTSFTSGATIPTVVTGSVSGFTASGTVTNDGGAPVTERGICWGTSHNPTTSGTHGSSGTGLGSYTVNLNLIMPGTTYYLRAYAINSQGTAYGNEVTFNAKSSPMTEGETTNIKPATETRGDNVTNGVTTDRPARDMKQ